MAKGLLAHVLQQLAAVMTAAAFLFPCFFESKSKFLHGFCGHLKAEIERDRKAFPFLCYYFRIKLRYFYRITNLEAVEFRFMPFLSVCSYVLSLAEETCSSYSCKCVFFSHNHFFRCVFLFLFFFLRLDTSLFF